MCRFKLTIELLVLVDSSNFESKYSILFDFYFSLLSLSLSTLFSFFDELRKFNESKKDFETFIRKIATMIWINSNRWVSKKSKLNELKLNELKIISSREISFVIVEFLTIFDKFYLLFTRQIKYEFRRNRQMKMNYEYDVRSTRL